MRATALLLIVAMPALAGCQQRKPESTTVQVSVIGGAARRADPSRGPLDMPERVLMGATAQGLVRFDAAGQIEAGLAERWNVVDTGRSFIFRLRDAHWPDGTPVTAEQVVHALRRAAIANSRNTLAPFLAAIDEIVAMTPQVIEVRLTAPRPDLLKLFAQPEMAVFEQRTLAGSGPFIVDSHASDGVTLRLAPDVAAPDDSDDPATVAKLQIHLRGEHAALALVRFTRHQVDLVLGGGFTDWPLVGLAGVAPAAIRVDPARGLFGLAIVNRAGFLGDAQNRAALAGAIDRQALTTLFRRDWQPIETLLAEQLDSASAPSAPSWIALTLDQRRGAARSRIAQWKQAHPDDSVAIRVALPQGPGANLLWHQLAATLRDIGAAPQRVALDAEAELRLIDAVAPYDGARWFVATACQLCSAEAKAAIDAARGAADLASRAQAITAADAALTADSAYIPIAQPLRWSIVAPGLPAWQGNPRAWHPLNHLRTDSQ